ncbi:ead/Ea22-like family protein [Cronobacter sakazakii]|nr:ead/Ea22-like family protein [Cronobacter sakazakii]
MTNTNELTAKLKAAAEKARWGDWSAYKPHSGARGYEVRVGIEAVAQHCLKDDAAFIAEASPKAVLCLIAALEAKDAQIAELEERLLRCAGIATRRAEHVAEIEKRIAELEAREHRNERQRVINGLADAGETWEEIQEYMKAWDACKSAGINLETGGGGSEMAFVSQVGCARNNSKTGLSVKFSKSGSTSCYVTVAISRGFRFIEVELDEETRRIRLKPSQESGARMSGKVGGQFSISKSFGRRVIPQGETYTFIELKKFDDEWWYGSYSASASNNRGEA